MERKFQSRYPGPGHSPGYQLWRVSNLWQRHISKALQPFGLTHVQFVILAGCAWLSQEEKPIIQIQVAQAAGTDEMMTSQVIRALAGRGLLTRQRHPDDARAKSLSVTDEGYKLAMQALEAVERVDAEFFGPLGLDEETQTRLLGRLVEYHARTEQTQKKRTKDD